MEKKLEVGGIFGNALVPWKYVEQRRYDIIESAMKRVVGEDKRVSFASLEVVYENPHKYSEHNRQALTEKDIQTLFNL